MVTKAEQQWIDGAQRRAEPRVLPHRDPAPGFRWWNPRTWFRPDPEAGVLGSCEIDELVAWCKTIEDMRDERARTTFYLSMANATDLERLCNAITGLSTSLMVAKWMDERANASIDVVGELRIPACCEDPAKRRSAQIEDWRRHAIAWVRAKREEEASMAAELAKLEASVTELTRQLSLAEASGGVARARFTDDGAWVTRGDRVYLGTAPEDILFVVDRLEAIDRETGVVFQLDEAQAVFAKRENARAWKRAHRNPSSSSPAATGSDPGISPSDGGTSVAPASGPARGDGAVEFDFLPLPMGGGLDV